jgi:DNA-binding NarL/FixJ family response regulator
MTAASPEPIRVVVADDQRAIREALAMLLDNENDIRVVGQASDGEEAVTLASGQGAQVVLMDVRMPGTDGVEATRGWQSGTPRSRSWCSPLTQTTRASTRHSSPGPSAI